MVPTFAQFADAVARHFAACSVATLDVSYTHVKGGIAPDSFDDVLHGAWTEHGAVMRMYECLGVRDPLLILLVNKVLSGLMATNDRRVVAQARCRSQKLR